MKQFFKTLEKLFFATIIAIIAGIVIRILTGIPIKTTVAALLFFSFLQVIEEYFSGGLRIAASWGKYAVRTAIAFVAFVALRFLVGQVFGLYPAYAYDGFGAGGGFLRTFWGEEAPRSVVWEVVLLGTLGGIMWGLLRKKRWANLIACVLGGFLLLGFLFPTWAREMWPKMKDDFEASVRERGLKQTVKEDFPDLPVVVIPTAGGNASSLGYNPDPLAISRHLYEEDARGINNHESQNDIDHFDLVLAGDGEFGKEGHVRPPSSWNDWKKYWVSDEPDRHVGFLYSGSQYSIGPFGANLPDPNDPRFSYKPREWMVQGKGTLRYERVR